MHTRHKQGGKQAANIRRMIRIKSLTLITLFQFTIDEIQSITNTPNPQVGTMKMEEECKNGLGALMSSDLPPFPAETRRDPFQILSHELMCEVVSYVPARDTETLRRVSKLWKVSSERALSTRSAVLKHFPWATSRFQYCDTEVQKNLLFRRCREFIHILCSRSTYLSQDVVYVEQNLNIGRVTRTIDCTQALHWSMIDDLLVCSDGRGKVVMRYLRSFPGMSRVPETITIIDCQTHFPGAYVEQLILISTSAIVLQLVMGKQPQEPWATMQAFVKVSSQGKIIWIYKVQPSASHAVISKDAMFFLCGKRESVSHCTVLESKAVLVKVSLEDGSLLSETVVRRRTLHPKLEAEGILGNSLVISKDHRLLCWKQTEHILLFDTAWSTGIQLQLPSKCCQITPLESAPGFRLVYPRVMYTSWIDCDQAGGWRLKHEFTKAFSHDRSNPNGMNHALFRGLFYDKVFKLHIGPVWTVHVVDQGNGLDQTFMEELGGDGLETFELPQLYLTGLCSYLGVRNGYQIYHYARARTLVLLDHWPAW